MEEEKLIQYIQGKLTSEKEITEVLDWIEASEVNRKRYTELKNLWVMTGLKQVKEQHSGKFFTKPAPAKPAKTISQKIISPLIRYAAVFVLAFFTGALALYLVNQNQTTPFYHTYNEIQVPNGEKSTITLYDGTRVWLNSGTTFKYPVAFHPKERKVYVNGEAYFDVSKKTDQPFIIQADQLKIKVLGTRFDVCAYHTDEKFFVTLEEGSVHARSDVNGAELVLSPGDQAVFSRKTNQLTQTKVDTDLYSSWKEDLLRFQDAPFKEVIKKMERWYDVNITLDGSINTEETYTMAIKTESLREMLNVLSKTTPMKYDINGKKVLITRP
jgi:ferric-dicitrate binding protein FerR (iron transport regulator)